MRCFHSNITFYQSFHYCQFERQKKCLTDWFVLHFVQVEHSFIYLLGIMSASNVCCLVLYFAKFYWFGPFFKKKKIQQNFNKIFCSGLLPGWYTFLRTWKAEFNFLECGTAGRAGPQPGFRSTGFPLLSLFPWGRAQGVYTLALITTLLPSPQIPPPLSPENWEPGTSRR